MEKTFWRTFPGVITALAGLLTAIGGFLFILYQIGWIGGKAVESQKDRIFIVGEVNDGTGKSIEGAMIRAINTVTNQEIGKEITDENGRYEMKLEFNRNKDRIKLITEMGGYRKYTLILGSEEVNYPAVLLKAND